jgi:NAD(P)-dependent dehydrogenase (short-subunit alcohol dehydrogenase family)
MDVTDEESVAASFAEAVLAFGGVDIVVSNAGLASSAAVTDTTLAAWRKTHDVLVTGYFLVSREAFRVLEAQGLGGSIVFVASKNALVATPGAVAYNSAKAAELHLARCLALEGAPHGIRVNTVNPDAVLQGSRIWAGAWREERARARIPVEETRGLLPRAQPAQARRHARGRRRGRSRSSPRALAPRPETC